MNTDHIQQELLLVTNTTFSQREWCEKDPCSSNQELSSVDQLEEICRNGLLNEMLPEIIERTRSGKKLGLWHIGHGVSFLEIELCEATLKIESQLSINPYYFLPALFYN